MHRKIFLILFLVCSIGLSGCSQASLNDVKAENVSLQIGEELYLEENGVDECISDDNSVVRADIQGKIVKLSALSAGTAIVELKKTEKLIAKYRIVVSESLFADFRLKSGNLIAINLSEKADYQVEIEGVQIADNRNNFDFSVSKKIAVIDKSGLITAYKSGVASVAVKEKKSGNTMIADLVVTGEKNYLSELDTGAVGAGNHVQGIDADTKGEYIYYSFTDRIIKQDINGNIVGSVVGFDKYGAGAHLGDIAFNDSDGMLYCSLTKNIFYGLPDEKLMLQPNCYVVIVDVNKINEMEMSPEKVSQMVYIGAPIVELAAQDGVGEYGDITQLGGKYGVLNTIDSMTFGPMFGEPDGKTYLTLGLGMVANSAQFKDDTYPEGVYARQRTDNDYIVLVQYDVTKWDEYKTVFGNFGTEGPNAFDNIYFYYMGYHDYGIQNLMYDEFLKAYFLTGYGLTNEPGQTQFPGYTFFVLDAKRQAEEKELIGNNEKGLTVYEKCGIIDGSTGICGYNFDASVGLLSFGDGNYFVASAYKGNQGQGAKLKLYKNNISEFEEFTDKLPFVAA